jgi:hypothetical protein
MNNNGRSSSVAQPPPAVFIKSLGAGAMAAKSFFFVGWEVCFNGKEYPTHYNRVRVWIKNTPA